MKCTINMKKVLFPLILFLIVSIFSGCGASKVQVNGRVVWTDGKPATELANGQIIFESAESRTSARGVIQSDGTFRVNTEGPNDGVLPGLYNIAIVEHRPAPEGSTRLAKQYLPDRFYSFMTSGLTVNVTSGTNSPVITVEQFSSAR